MAAMLKAHGVVRAKQYSYSSRPNPQSHPSHSAHSHHTQQQDVDDLESTAGNLRALSSTGGSGGVLDRYYMPWKLHMHQNPRFFQAVSQLWAATFAACPNNDDPEHARVYSNHPFGPFDPSKGYAYIDRVGFRVPDRVAQLHRKGKRPLQRSLTPHLDCCPSALYDSGVCVCVWKGNVHLMDGLGGIGAACLFYGFP